MQAQKADAIANLLGLQRVGMIFNQNNSEKDYIVNNEEVYQMCEISAQVGEHCVIAVFSMMEEDGHVRAPLVCAALSLLRCKPSLSLSVTTSDLVQREVHLEAFQCSNQAVQLWKDGWFREPDKDAEISGVSNMKNPHDAEVKLPVMISGKDTDEVDNDFFLVPVAVKDHEGPFMSSFAVENRLTGQVWLHVCEWRIAGWQRWM